MPPNTAPLLMERDLLIRVSQGDEKAFRQLYDLFRSRIYSIAWKFTGTKSSAEDIVQDVFLKIWVHREDLAGIHHFHSYINTVTRNHIFNHLRKMANEDAFLRDLMAKGEPAGKDGFDVTVYNQLQQLLDNTVASLPPQQKKIYLLSRREGLGHDEIAERLKLSRSTVKGHIVEALKFIRLHLLEKKILLWPVLIFFTGV